MRPSVPDSRRWVARGAALLAVLALLAPAAASAATYEPADSELRPRPGAIRDPAEGMTIVAVQGFHFRGRGATKKPARLIAFGPEGEPRWIYNGSDVGARWFYDVDPLPGGNLLVTATDPDGTIVMSLDPETREPAWVERLPYHDTHDVDLLEGDRLLVANMRNYRPGAGVNDDRVLIYDRSEDRVVWEFLFRKHGFERSGGGAYAGEHDDWTHVNDVDEIAPGEFLVSVRNFDQVIVVNRSSKEITLRLGRDGRHRVMYEQHNPQYLESESGRPTVLVADSENDRIVEYERRRGEWVRTWSLAGDLSWPRDADRLPNGNTLIVDSLNHRVLEVTPRGRIVWEVYAPWGTYDAERVRLGDEPGGPTIADQGATGNYTVHGSAGYHAGNGATLAADIEAAFAGTPLAEEAAWLATRWAHIAPWIYPVWMDGWEFAGVVAAALLALGWAVAEIVAERRTVAALLRRGVP